MAKLHRTIRIPAQCPMLAAALLVLASACTPLRPLYLTLPPELIAEPNYICNGDTVSVVWNVNPPQHQDFCEYPTGGYPSALACSAGSDCPAGGLCSDGFCCASPIPLRECGNSCPADSTSTLTFDPSGPNQSNPYGSGRTTFSPGSTTLITLTGSWGPPTTPTAAATARVVVVDEPPLENLLMGFSFACMESGYGWSNFDLAFANVLPSPRVVIASVRNTSGHQIRLSDGVHPAVILDAGAPSTEFNGPLAGTLWSASLTSIGAFGLPMPRCTPLDLSDAYPDLSVEVTLACNSEP